MAIADFEKYSPVKEAQNAYNEMIVEADELLQEIIEEGRQRAALAELAWFQQNLNWDETRVKQELRRMHSVLRLKSIAGSPSDRQAAQREATTAAEVLEKQGPKLSDEIAKLTAKLTGLERDQRLASKRVEDQSLAINQLRELCPEHIRKSVNEERNQLDSTIMRTILDAQVRTNELECNLDQSRYPDPASYLEALQRSCREAVQVGGDGQMIRRQLSPAWPTIRVTMESELSTLRKTITKLQAEYDTLLAPIESKLNFYAR